MPNSFIKSFYLGFISLFITLAVKADYSYRSLYQIILESNYCAEGKIVKLDNDYFYLQVDRFLMGELEEDTIAIKRFYSWPCGRRLQDYAVGQAEVVFFSKTNEVIPIFDYVGYGGGDEYELAVVADSVYYNILYGKQVAIPKSEFVRLIQDFVLARENEIRLDSSNYENHYIKTTVYRLDRALNNIQEEDYDIEEFNDSFEPRGLLLNLGPNILYKNFENKILYYTNDTMKVFPYSDNSELRMVGDTIFITPLDGWAGRNLAVYDDTTRSRETLLASQFFEIIDLPAPKLFFDIFYRDSLYLNSSGIFSRKINVGHLLDYLHVDDNLKYTILNYTLEIHHADSVESIFVKSARGNKSLKDFMLKVRPYDSLVYKNPVVLYPNGEVHTIPDQTFFIFPESDWDIHHPTGND